ncbi:unnamed protein product [Miscanthus lutarioriparius]|uniref:Uncharacterized protein n=1 Tax=Miscanthus lutarioriparius TaxID=422564 RepID=A0A811PIB8_9POAL|nr:unnamed protein product [Miscanthus lutarioriparius]
MAMRTALSSLPARLRAPAAPASAAATGGLRLLSDGKGRVLSEEERAKESVYIQKMEKERLEKLKKRLEQEKSGNDKAKPTDADKLHSTLPTFKSLHICRASPKRTVDAELILIEWGWDGVLCLLNKMDGDISGTPKYIAGFSSQEPGMFRSDHELMWTMHYFD